jgi:two-component system, NarL family, nitrate/nitrite response regulator NarL
MPGPSVLIVEDHLILSHALAAALTTAGCGRVDVQEAERLDAAAVLEAVGRLRPDVVLLDLNLGDGRRGVPLIEPIRRLHSPVLVLTASDDPVVLGEVLDAGATAVVMKTQPFRELTDAVLAAAAGQRTVPVGGHDELIAAWRRRRDQRALFDRLTASEAAVLAALVDGCSVEVIAKSRGVAIGTVRSQVKALLRKLQVGSQLAAVARAREANWPDL